MTKTKHPNRNGNDQARERLALLIGELAPEARTATTSPTEPAPIFRWPNPSTNDDQQDALIEVDLPVPERPGDHSSGPDTPTDTMPANTWRPDAWLTEKTASIRGADSEFSAIDPASGDPPSRAPTPLDQRPSSAGAEPDGLAGQLVERWLPGGNRAVDGMRSLVRRRRGLVLAVVVFALAAAIGTAIAMASSRPTAEAAPALPPAVSAMAHSSSAAPSTPANTHIVVSVVGKVTNPGLVTLPDGARVADAVRAAGGVLPGTDVTTVNLARKLADGEQIYVGIPIPSGLSEPAPDSVAGSTPTDTGSSGSSSSAPAKKTKKGKSSATLAPGEKVNLNTASVSELEALPGVGDATAQRIVDWRSQHGSFNSIDQLHDVGGIGASKFGKLKDLVTV